MEIAQNKSIEVRMNEMNNGNRTLGLDVRNAHIDLSTHYYGNGGNCVHFTMFDLTKEQITDIINQMVKKLSEI